MPTGDSYCAIHGFVLCNCKPQFRNARHDEMTLADVVAARDVLVRANTVTTNGVYVMPIHSFHVQQALMLAKRLKYKGSRKARNASKRMNVLYEEIARAHGIITE